MPAIKDETEEQLMNHNTRYVYNSRTGDYITCTAAEAGDICTWYNILYEHRPWKVLRATPRRRR